MDRLLGGSNPLAALQQLAGGAGGDAMARLMPNMDEMTKAMEALAEIDAQPKYICGPGVDDLMLHETKQWCVVYPHYIDVKRTIKQGRRIPKSLAIENPDAKDIAEACTVLGLRWLWEDKCYPRDFLLRGRVRIELYTIDKSHPVKGSVPNKCSLLQRVAETIMHMKKNRTSG